MKHVKLFENYKKYDKLVDNTKNPMLRGYIECALFADLPEEYNGQFGSEDINEDSLLDAAQDVAAFKLKAETLLSDVDEEDYNQVGMDFWYSRNGHGTGFWDRTELYGEETAKALDKIAQSFLAKSVFVQNDEFIIE